MFAMYKRIIEDVQCFRGDFSIGITSNYYKLVMRFFEMN